MPRKPQPVLSENKLYTAFDRIVCGRATCAGESATYTGITIGGAKVTPFTDRDAKECRDAGFEPTCECGAVTATAKTISTGPVRGTIAWIAHPSDPDATWLALFDGQRWRGTYYLDGTDNFIPHDHTVRIIGPVTG